MTCIFAVPPAPAVPAPVVPAILRRIGPAAAVAIPAVAGRPCRPAFLIVGIHLPLSVIFRGRRGSLVRRFRYKSRRGPRLRPRSGRQLRSVGRQLAAVNRSRAGIGCVAHRQPRDRLAAGLFHFGHIHAAIDELPAVSVKPCYVLRPAEEGNVSGRRFNVIPHIRIGQESIVDKSERPRTKARDFHINRHAKPTRRKRRPPAHAAAIAPDHPCRSPNPPRNPAPSFARQNRPASVMIAAPSERLVAHPIPAVIRGVDPIPRRVRAPIRPSAGRLPAWSIAGNLNPLTIRGQIVIEIVSFVFGIVIRPLRTRRWRRARHRVARTFHHRRCRRRDRSPARTAASCGQRDHQDR
jgi:hypothetical protein